MKECHELFRKRKTKETENNGKYIKHKLFDQVSSSSNSPILLKSSVRRIFPRIVVFELSKRDISGEENIKKQLLRDEMKLAAYTQIFARSSWLIWRQHCHNKKSFTELPTATIQFPPPERRVPRSFPFCDLIIFSLPPAAAAVGGGGHSKCM